MSSAARCPDNNFLPDFHGIPGLPSDVTVGFVPASRNNSLEAMTACCSPRPVSLASDCYYWCELSTGTGFGSCLRLNGIEPGITGMHTSGGAASPMTGRKLVGLAAWALFVAAALHL
ncbi:hypothetical protein LX32DRAFT_695481 [Colletotrichum zoysiae]|uniref:Uncharacterized protein n=1 Tax=Colletotrichum zoysiae TaxID=1216348 RepID=A0AAD9HCZ8_9PEZI|nr:hypothetical protein LX32DRAFT_695481 [Colletotrichum zoysiae]